MMMMPARSRRFRKILQVGELTRLGGGSEIAGELGELGGGGGITLGLGGLRGILQVGGDFLCGLRVLGRVRLLKLLQRAHQLGEG